MERCLVKHRDNLTFTNIFTVNYKICFFRDTVAVVRNHTAKLLHIIYKINYTGLNGSKLIPVTDRSKGHMVLHFRTPGSCVLIRFEA